MAGLYAETRPMARGSIASRTPTLTLVRGKWAISQTVSGIAANESGDPKAAAIDVFADAKGVIGFVVGVRVPAADCSR